MNATLITLTVVSSAAVLIVLILGLANLLRSGSASLSQTLMRWRILLQALAIVLAFGVVYLTRGG